MVDLIAIQEEQIEWSERNFGKQHARYPLLGMIEEVLELDAAWKARTDACMFDIPPQEVMDRMNAEVLDAVGDIGIYMLDYCGKKGLSLNDLWKNRIFYDVQTQTKWWDLTPFARAFAHHQLKGEQGIRGTPEEHDAKIQDNCRYVLAHLECICDYLQKNFLITIDSIWSKVRQRDWVKNRANAHEVAAQAEKS